jgi:hypothetical protein
MLVPNFPWSAPVLSKELASRRGPRRDLSSSLTGKRSCSVSMAVRASKTCIPVRTMAKYSSTPSMRWTATICAACRCRCASQPWTATGAPARRHLHQPVGAGRDRTRPISQGLRVRPRGNGIEAPAQSYRSGNKLDQDQEPETPADDADQEGICMTEAGRVLFALASTAAVAAAAYCGIVWIAKSL